MLFLGYRGDIILSLIFSLKDLTLVHCSLGVSSHSSSVLNYIWQNPFVFVFVLRE